MQFSVVRCAPLASFLWILCCSEPAKDPAPPPVAASPPTSVLVVTFDTTRADHLGCYGSPLGATPALDRFAEQSVLFERAMSPAPVTLPSHSTIFTGLDPILHGVHDNGIFCLDADQETLAERLRDRGYRTAAFVSADVLAPRYGLAQGFEVYDQPASARRTDGLRPGERRAHQTVGAFATWLAGVGEGPWFAWIHFFDPHQPLTPLPEFAARFPLSPYSAELAAADTAFGQLVALLESRGLADRLLWVVTADHGESLGEHGEPTHGFGLYDNTQHVPLLVRGPRFPARRVAGQVGLVDLCSTILDCVADDPLDPPFGPSLRAVLEGTQEPRRDVYLETQLSWYSYESAPLEGISTGTEKLIQAPGPGLRTRLYDLLADPQETQDLSGERPDLVAELQGRMGELRHGRSPLPGAPNKEMDEAELERLRQLGYFQGGGPSRSFGDPGKAPLPADAMPLIDLLQKAVMFLDQGSADAALAPVTEVVQRWPEHAIAHAVRGQALRDLGDTDGARQEFERALELRPDLAVTAVDLARLHVSERHANKALKVLDKLLEVDPVQQEVLMYAAEVAGRKGDWSAAAGYLERLRELEMSSEQKAEVERRLEALAEQRRAAGH